MRRNRQINYNPKVPPHLPLGKCTPLERMKRIIILFGMVLLTVSAIVKTIATAITKLIAKESNTMPCATHNDHVTTLNIFGCNYTLPNDLCILCFNMTVILNSFGSKLVEHPEPMEKIEVNCTDVPVLINMPGYYHAGDQSIQLDCDCILNP
jgi:hypothetical protein